MQEVLFTTCAQRGTVCQIFISTGLIHKSWAAGVGEPTLSPSQSAKGHRISRGSGAQIVSTQSLTASSAAFGGICLSKWNLSAFSEHFEPITHAENPSLPHRRNGKTGMQGEKGSQGMMSRRCINLNCCAQHCKAMDQGASSCTTALPYFSVLTGLSAAALELSFVTKRSETKPAFSHLKCYSLSVCSQGC